MRPVTQLHLATRREKFSDGTMGCDGTTFTHALKHSKTNRNSHFEFSEANRSVLVPSRPGAPIVASLLLVAMPGDPDGFLFLVARPGATIICVPQTRYDLLIQ